MKNLVSGCIKRFYLNRSEAELWLAASVGFSICMVISVSVFNRALTMGFLVWNLFLAFIPLAISNWMSIHARWKRNRIKFCMAFVSWLLFIPNSFYIITDLFHLNSFRNLPLWYELAVILSFAWNGLLIGIISIRQMENLFEEVLPARARVFFVYPIMFLNALGIYIGRYLRFNSWDIITNPIGLARSVSDLALNPVEYRYAWAMVICFSVFMTLIFFSTRMFAHKGSSNY